MSRAVLERRPARRQTTGELEAPVFQLGWKLGSETPVQGMVRGTKLEPGSAPATNSPSPERLGVLLTHAAERLSERDREHVTRLAVTGRREDPIGRVARDTLISERRPVEASPLRTLHRWLRSERATEFLAVVTEWVRLGGFAERGSSLALTPLEAARELKTWLGLSWTELATAAEIHEGTIHYWQRTPEALPRPATVAGLYELHSLTLAVRRRLLSEEDFRAWLHGADSDGSPLEALRSARREDFRAAAQRVVFGPPAVASLPTPPPNRTWRGEEEPDLTVATPARARRTARRRPRARLP